MAGGRNRRIKGMQAFAGTPRRGLLHTLGVCLPVMAVMLISMPASSALPPANNATLEAEEPLASPAAYGRRAPTDAGLRSARQLRAFRSADDGLAIASNYTYTVDPLANVIHVVAVVALTNTVPNQRSGNYINKTYFNGFSVPVPVEAVGIAGTQNGSPVAVAVAAVEGEDELVRADVEFAARLFYNRTAEVVLSYDLAGGAPRGIGMSRINAAYTSFTAFGVADPGALTVNVIVPANYVIDKLGSDVVESVDEAGNTVYTATDIAVPEEFGLFISARNDAALTTEDHAVGSIEFTIKSWPDDAPWRDFIDDHLDRGVPVLEDLIGRPWPETRPIVISEAVTSYLYGYVGWYNAGSKTLELGEDLDPVAVLHELSHVWFNGEWFTDRWITEGLAQQYAGLANEELGEAAVSPVAIDPSAAGAAPLSSWDDLVLSDTADGVEDFGYNASWFVIDGIVDDIGIDVMHDVFEATDDQTISYVGDAPAEDLRLIGDWRRFLDLTEIIGGSTVAHDLIERYVVTPEEQPLLKERSTARAAYAELEEAGDGWAAPLVVRKYMSLWMFDGATNLMIASTGVLEDRDALVTTLADLGIEMDPALEAEYEASETGLHAAIALLDDAVAEADAVVASRDRALQGLQDLGIEPTADFDTGTVTTESSLDDAATAFDDVIDATSQVRSAIDLVEADRGMFEQIGLLGTDVDTVVRAAKLALAAGDTTTARTRADEATALINDSGDVGSGRVAVAAAGFGGVLVILLILVILRKRHRRAPSALDDTDPAHIDGSSESVEPRELVAVTTRGDHATEEPPLEE